MPDADSQSPAERIDNRYEIVRQLGRGGFGAVFLVRDTLLRRRQVALKILRPLSGERGDFDERFLSEIEILRGLRHEGIPQIFDTGRTSDGALYFTMEYIEGVSLAVELKNIEQRKERIAPDRMVKIVHRVLETLDYAHSRGVVHRDLKPGNIMLVRPGAPDEDVRVLDFGIAKVMRGAAGGLDLPSLATTHGMGTPHYMAPEQLRGKDIDARTDLYALGVILYQMCCGRFPFKGDSDLAIATARLEDDPEPFSDDTPTPDWMRKLVFGLLERKKDNRPTTRDVLALLLRAQSDRDFEPTLPLASNATTRANVQEPDRRAGAATKRELVPLHGADVRSLETSKPRGKLLAGAVAFALTVALGTWAAFFRGESAYSSSDDASKPASVEGDDARPQSATEDRDGDGTPDERDLCPDDPLKTAPGLCGCGFADTDTDGDKTPDCNDGCPNDPNKVAPGSCGCGKPDVDTDGDTTPDCNDECPNDPNKLAPGICGCGVSDVDTDGDGTVDCRDLCPNDPKKTEPGKSGCGNPEVDSRVVTWAEVLEAAPDPKVVTDATLHAAIKATGLPWRVRDRRSKIEMLLVPPGSYTRGASPGDSESDDYEKPAHNVQITKAFYLGRYEVMEREWKRVRDNVDSSVEFGLPQVLVSHDEIVNWLAYTDGLRLPTEGEWEYACRAGTNGSRYGDLDDVAVHRSNSDESLARVGTKRANAFGLHDMLGNTNEWCSDWASYYESVRFGVRDPQGPGSGPGRVLRGGSFAYGGRHCRASYRVYADSDNRADFRGFRVARTP